jgi:hypothetical protein
MSFSGVAIVQATCPAIVIDQTSAYGPDEAGQEMHDPFPDLNISGEPCEFTALARDRR